MRRRILAAASRIDMDDVLLTLGAALSGVGLYELHPKAFFGGMAVAGVLLIHRVVR